jgi:recombinational DNA repair protein (RecF pathway)
MKTINYTFTCAWCKRQKQLHGYKVISGKRVCKDCLEND